MSVAHAVHAHLQMQCGNGDYSVPLVHHACDSGGFGNVGGENGALGARVHDEVDLRLEERRGGETTSLM